MTPEMNSAKKWIEKIIVVGPGQPTETDAINVVTESIAEVLDKVTSTSTLDPEVHPWLKESLKPRT